jgi:quercetin dioxygenase-like cupin family protein
MNLLPVQLALLLAIGSFLQDRAVPVEEEPLHHTVLKNEYIQAFRLQLEPGKWTGMHTHSHDDVAVRLSTATTTSETLGQPAGAPENEIPGMVSARSTEPKSLTHRVHNVGSTVFDVIDVQVLSRPAGPKSAAIAPVVAENPRMRVYRYELEPGAASPEHTHHRPYLVVAATDINLRMTSPDGSSMEHPVKAGDMHWVDSEVTHTLINHGTNKAVLVEIELK